MDETKYLQAKQEVGNILKSMIVGFIGWGIIGAILGYIIYMTGGNISHLLGMVLIMGIGLMGMPYVWSKLPYAISSSFLVTVIWFSVKFWISCIGGMIATPIILIVQLIKLNRHKPSVQ